MATAKQEVARHAERRARAKLHSAYSDQDWQLLLAAYLAEAEGRAVWSDELCIATGSDARAGHLRVWQLIARGALIVEASLMSIKRISVRVSPRDAALIERHLLTMAGCRAFVGPGK